MIQRLRIDPYSDYLERYRKAKSFPVSVANGFVFVSGLPPILIRMIQERAPQGMEARALAYGTSIQQMGSAIAPLVAGLVAPYLGLSGFFWACSVMLIAGWVLWRRRGHTDGARLR